MEMEAVRICSGHVGENPGPPSCSERPIYSFREVYRWKQAVLSTRDQVFDQDSA